MAVIQIARKFAAEQIIAGEEALKKGMEEKSKAFMKPGSEFSSKA
jgi:phosphomethylpyrimidine synthase